MSLTYGFYNSLAGDRKYNASQISMLFDGLITDGIFMSIGSKMMVTENSGMNISIGTGRAWFNHTWSYNDAIVVLPLDLSEVLLPRIDAVVLEVNSTESIRQNSFKIIKGTPATVPTQPLMVDTNEVHQYPLAYIYVGAGVSAITQANITNAVGTSETPFVTGIMEGMDIDALIDKWEAQWSNWTDIQESEFLTWFNSIKDQLTTDAATSLQLQINNITNPSNSKTTPVDSDFVLVADSAASNQLKKTTWVNIKATIKSYFDTIYASLNSPTLITPTVSGSGRIISNDTATGTAVYEIWSGTEAQHNAISTKDPNTMYFIV